MIHRFPNFEIDEARRELRVSGRVVEVQPRIFAVLAHLARHRDRVVPKEELLEAVWPDVIVTDASLQRAISLARAALAPAGASGAIRTYSRLGYRLCAEAVAAAPSAAVEPDALERARAAYERGEWDAVLAAFRSVDAVEGLAADDLQRCAHAAQCAGRPQEAFPLLERAVAVCAMKGDRRGAARVAVMLAHLRFEWREPILAKGWVHQAERLLQGEAPGREQGYLRFVQARLALSAGDAPESLRLAREAQAIGAQEADADLEALGLSFAGEAMLALGRVSEGVAAMDEAGAAVVARNLSAWAGGLVYCCVIYNCMARADWHRAAEWSGQFTRWCEHRGAGAYPGLCRLHRAEVLTVGGRLDEAEAQIEATLADLSRRAPWAEGYAWLTQGEIRLARGDFAGARAAFTKAQELGWDAHFNLGQLRYAEGDPAGAEPFLAHALTSQDWTCQSQRGRVLIGYVLVAAAAGRIPEARRALAELEAHPELTGTSALRALLARARAELAIAEGRMEEAVGLLRTALRGLQQVDAPLAGAEARCRLAAVLAEAGQGDLAAIELAAARTAFEQAGAAGLLQQCQRLRQALPVNRSAG